MENGKKKEKTNQAKGADKEKGDPPLAFASERPQRGCPSAPVERKGTVSRNEKKKEKDTEAKESPLGGQRTAVGAE